METKLPSTQVLSCAEVEIHYKRPLFETMKVVKNPDDANQIIRAYIDISLLDVKEFFWSIFLTRANTVLGMATLGSGNLAGVIVNVREIIQLALLSQASQVIVAHNHPSGKLVPSNIDKQITKKISEGLALFDIKLMDHLIVTSESYYSFANEGDL